MAVAFDAQTITGTWNGSPETFVHTPVGTPRGVTVGIDFFVGTGTASAVTYGGVAMSQVISVQSGNANGENGRAEIWFLGTGIPTGAQTVSITHNGSGIINQASCVTVTAAADTVIGDSDSVTGVVDDPSLTSTSSATALRHGVIYTGVGDISGVLAGAGLTAIGNHTNGNRTSRHDRQTTPSSGGFVWGYTTTSADEVALVVVAVQEAAPAVPTAPSSLVATTISGSQIDLTWTDNSSDETSFRIERSPNGSTGWASVGTNAAGDNTFSNTGLTCGTQYFYRVFAVNGAGDSTASNTDDATTTACPPSAGGGQRMGGSGAILKPPRGGR